MLTPYDDIENPSHAQMKEMMREAAEWGARKALADLGLHDEDAGTDVKELRGLLDSWRATKAAAWSTTVKVITTGFLSLIGLAILIKTGNAPKL